jgi:hypothetical protein
MQYADGEAEFSDDSKVVPTKFPDLASDPRYLEEPAELRAAHQTWRQTYGTWDSFPRRS